jgi:hypothetical protein
MKENTPMTTSEELETLIQNLIERMNRVEASTAHRLSSEQHIRSSADDALATKLDAAIARLDIAMSLLEQRKW